MRARTVLSLVCVVLAVAAWVGANPQRPQIHVTTDKPSYEDSESTVRILVQIVNPRDEPTSFDYLLGNLLGISVFDSTGAEVAFHSGITNWQVFTQDLPHGVTTFSDFWPTRLGRWSSSSWEGDDAPPGMYHIRVSAGRAEDEIFVGYSQPFEIHSEDDHPVRLLYVPVAGNGPGRYGSSWRSILDLTGYFDFPNISRSEPEVTVALIEPGVDNSNPRTAVALSGFAFNARFENVLEELFDYQGSAALRVTMRGGDWKVSSRSLNTNSTGTFGQVIPAMEASAAGAYGFDLLVTDLQSSARDDRPAGQRTNIGIINLSNRPMDLRIFLANVDQQLLDGLWPDFIGELSVYLAPYGYQQLGDVFLTVSEEEVDRGIAVIRSTSGGSFLAYGSVVDNITGNGYFVQGQRHTHFIR